MHAALKHVKHESCKGTLAISRGIMVSWSDPLYSFIKDIDGRWRVYPTMTTVAYNCVVVRKLSKRMKSLKIPNQRQLVTELTLKLSYLNICEKGCRSEVVLNHVLWCSTNIFCAPKFSNKALTHANKSRKAEDVRATGSKSDTHYSSETSQLSTYIGGV